VFYFHNFEGEVIYIGRGKNIKEQIITLFENKQNREEMAELKREIFNISYELTGSELIANFMELNELRKINPKYNKYQGLAKYKYGIFKEELEGKSQLIVKALNEIEKAENSNYNIDPMCTPLRWYSGSAHYNLGNQELAYADFSKAYQINPHHVHVINNLATAYEIKGNHIVAIDLYKKAIHISPSFEEAKTNLCATYFNAGQKQNAFIEFQKLKVDTSDLKYRKMLNLILCQEISRMSDSISCDPIKNMLKAIFNTPPWYLQIYVKSKSDKVSFNKQLIDDAIFTLDSTEKRINFAYIKSLQKKYTTKKITND